MKTVQAELRAFLNSSGTTTNPVLRDRNIEIVLYLYGFGGPRWPKLREAAARFDLKKQRVDQVEDEYLSSRAAAFHFGALRESIRLVKTAPWWLDSCLTTALRRQGVVDPGFSTPGLLRLAATTGLEVSHAAYVYTTTGGLVEVTSKSRVARAALETCPDFFLMDRQYLPRVRALLRSAKSFHNKYGLARVSDLLSTQEQGADEDRVFLEQLLRVAPDGWTTCEGDELWYCFEKTKDNAIRNTVAKVLTALDYGDVGDSCDARELARAFVRDLSERTGTKKYPHAAPPEEIVYRYLTSSPSFTLRDGQIQFAESRNGKLNDIDRDLVDCLKASPAGSTRPDVQEHLASKHDDAYIRQTLQYSPLIRVDERKGHGDYRYFLIGTERPDSTSDWERRYAHYKDRLDTLSRTDIQSSSSSRAEQHALRDWLFEGKEDLDCALCGKRFVLPNDHEANGDRRTSPLVAAHKKKRANCTDAERRDPYIVMPLCQFGCDFVYEHRYVTIRDGVIVRGRHREDEDAVADYVSKLLDGDRRVADEWTKGCSSYFDDA